MTEKAKLPGVKGPHLGNPRNDSSVTFKVVGGEFDGIPLRLYPFQGGFRTIVLPDGRYEAVEGASKPILHWKED